MRDVAETILSDSGPAGHPLRALLAAEGGAVSVERFMQAALYHPRYGYYTRRVRSVGREGDFSTSVTLHQALGRAVAAWACGHRGSVARGGRWHLIELGGGSGELAAEIRRSLGAWAGRGLRYHLVEISEGLRAEQQRRLAGWRHVRWHADIRDALRAAGGRALLFSNEFVDAFPCVQLVRDGATGHWREVFVTWPDAQEHPMDEPRPWSGPVPGPTMPTVPGQRVEIHLAYQRWLAGWQTDWHAGRLLTIDYGDTLPGLYHRRSQGTLRAYVRHQRVTGPEVYQRFGQQDITADVNFTDLRTWGEALGLATAGYGTQAELLRRWLPPRSLARARDDLTLARLLDPDGVGGAFKVLEQVRLPDQNAA